MGRPAVVTRAPARSAIQRGDRVVLLPDGRIVRRAPEGGWIIDTPPRGLRVMEVTR